MRERRTGVIQAFSSNAMCSFSIAIASLQRARRFGAAGLFLLGSVALAGSDSPILGRSLSINGMKTSSRCPRVRRRSYTITQARSKIAAYIRQ